ncbi:MAG: hypothetical protein QM809_04660 [Gordonia sp. (in: high G+C Gram-positive bacteria)]|uniref:hypothetical protein n=1 Tax=Gordonia sp. (in: high G+C Gram-positive bacteria) TaxID=84139 RepID=UPI0039E37F43
MRGFSRVVLGAADTEPLADRFLRQELPVASAGTEGFYPERFRQLRGGKAKVVVGQAVDFLTGREPGELDYRGPRPSRMQTQAKASFSQRARRYASFLGFALLVLLGRSAKPVSVVRSKQGFLGPDYDSGTPASLPDWGVRVPDFDALDADAAEQAWTALDELARTLAHDPPRSSPETWRLVIDLATSVSDGGPGPAGWEPEPVDGRTPVLAPVDVRATPPEPVVSDVPELRAARTPAVAASAVTAAGLPRSPALEAPDDGSIVATTPHALVDEGNSRDRHRLHDQLAGIVVPEVEPAHTLLDRLAATVSGATLRSRLDAERWREFATEPSSDDLIDWPGAARLFRQRAFFGALACAIPALAWVVGWFIVRADAPSWLRIWIGPALALIVFVAFLLWSVSKFSATYRHYLERGRRRLEVRRRWLDRAREAMIDNARLRALDPTLNRWLALLSALYQEGDDVIAPVDRVLPENTPRAMAVAVPLVDDHEITAWLRDRAAVLGWRSRALARMLADGLETTPEEALAALADDDGRDSGELAGVCARSSELWERYAEQTRAGAATAVAERLVNDPARPLRVMTPRSRRDQPVRYTDFEREPWPQVGADDDEWAEMPDFAVHDRLGPDTPRTGRMADNVCALAVRIQFRTVGDRQPDPPQPSFDPNDY